MSNLVKSKTVDTLQKWVYGGALNGRFEAFLGSKTAQFLTSMLSVVGGSDQLQKCAPDSIVKAAMVAALMDLPIDPNLGFAYIVPYKGAATFQMGYKGFVQLAIRTGQYQKINATVIHESQVNSYNPVTDEFEFDFDCEPSGCKMFIAYIRMTNGFEKFHMMTEKQANDHGKKYSQSFKKGFGPWKDNFDGMALKTCLKLLLSKYGYLSVEMQTAVKSDQSEILIDKDTGEISAKYSDNSGDITRLGNVKKTEPEPEPEADNILSKWIVSFMAKPAMQYCYDGDVKKFTEAMGDTWPAFEKELWAEYLEKGVLTYLLNQDGVKGRYNHIAHVKNTLVNKVNQSLDVFDAETIEHFVGVLNIYKDCQEAEKESE